MISQRFISRFSVRTGVFDQSTKILGSRSDCPVHALSSLSNTSEQSSKSLSHIPKNDDAFPGNWENLKGQTRLFGNVVPRFLGNLGMKLGFAQANFQASSIHTSGTKEFERDTRSTGRNIGEFENTRTLEMNRNNTGRFETGWNRNTIPTETGRNSGPFERGWDTRPYEMMGRNSRPIDYGRNTRSMNFVRGIMEDNEWDFGSGGSQYFRYGVEQNADIVHIKLMRNNTFVTVTDSKGNKKAGASAGSLSEMKGGPKVSRYAAEATSEYVGRLARNMGLKSVVVKVNGSIYFKKKKQAVLSFRDGYSNSRTDQNPVVYIEDTTRKPHNGCRLRKKRRV